MMDDMLRTVIDAENDLNEIIREHAPGLFESARPLVGRAILKADGSLRKDALAALEIPRSETHEFQCFRNSTSSNLSFTFKVCRTRPNKEQSWASDHCHYAQTTVYIGDLEGGVLESVSDFDPEEYSKVHDFDTVRALQKKCQEAKKAYEDARSACYPFGEE